MTLLVIIFWMLAAICNALMDISAHKFESSIFSHKDPFIWDAKVSWKNKYNNRDPELGRRRWFYGLIVLHPAFTDAWHFAKSLMIVCICAVVALLDYEVITHLNMITTQYGFIKLTIGIFLILGISWNVTFSFFYDVVFRKKKEGQ